MGKILITGALGQIGSELSIALSKKYGNDQVIRADIKAEHGELPRHSGQVKFVDVTKPTTLLNLVKKYKVDVIYHLAAILSALGEQQPHLAWNVNMDGLHNVLEIAREYEVRQIFFPSSIAVFGPDAAKENTPQEEVLHPTTLYGVTKVSGELLCEYYSQNYNLDIRGVRYPGLISSETLPGGGTTDYAVDIFYEAIKNQKYRCFVRQDTVLPMMYMPDAIEATLQLMEADKTKLKHCNAYNIAAISFSAGELASEIKKHIPEFTCEYQPDIRQKFADSWPKSIDDSIAREEWGWQPQYDLATMTKDMLEKLRARLT